MLDESFQFHEGMDSLVVDLVAPGAGHPRLDGLATARSGVGAFVVCWIFRAEVTRFRPTFLFFCVGGVLLAATSAFNFGHAPPSRVVAEQVTKLLGVCSFFLGYSRGVPWYRVRGARSRSSHRGVSISLTPARHPSVTPARTCAPEGSPAP